MNIALLTLGRCSWLTLGAVYELFSLVNQAQTNHEYRLYRLDDAISPAFDLPKGQWDDRWDVVILVSDVVPNEGLTDTFSHRLSLLFQRNSIRFISLDSAIYWLIESGFSVEQPIALDWQQFDYCKTHYPEVNLSSQLYCVGDKLTTCVGKVAALDCLLDFLANYEHERLINELVEKLCLDRFRSREEKQKLPICLVGSDIQPRLTMALELMANNLEEPLTTEEIAELVHISRRQLERLFKQYLNTMPAKHYLQLRLERARHLLKTTQISIIQIGLMCGFSSGPHFSSSYKTFYNLTPREERSKQFSSFYPT